MALMKQPPTPPPRDFFVLRNTGVCSGLCGCARAMALSELNGGIDNVKNGDESDGNLYIVDKGPCCKIRTWWRWCHNWHHRLCYQSCFRLVVLNIAELKNCSLDVKHQSINQSVWLTEFSILHLRFYSVGLFPMKQMKH